MHVTLVDVMGDDLRVVNAARVSFAKESNWTEESVEDALWFDEPYLDLSEQDQKLIKYLAKHNHWTPFSHVMITMREKVPVFVARQRFKHMVGFTYNEVSRRYVDEAPEFFTPDVWRGRAENKKQGSSDEEVDMLLEIQEGIDKELRYKIDLEDWYSHYLDEGKRLYELMIEAGVAPEQARMVLPQSMYTEYYVTGSLAAWARAYKLRSEEHAQKEIQDLAKQWNEIIGGIETLRYSWNALTSTS